ncbi:MAG: hypothetical protein AB7Q42_01340 [Acidimicrobiia bacterium]
MAFAFVHDVPLTDDLYAQVRAELGSEPPPGLIAHLVIRTESGLRYVDAWENEADWDRFHEEAVHPALHKVLGFDPPRNMGPTPVELVDAWIPGREFTA